ncbi:MAG: aminomethyl-transferring glycine dehydrogenase subunit GcvPB [Eggerthellaceae bacterium]|nr:aminomethyl-transferring glycine dehydrogenase subunit GcvPB [Eggerthellaceae bacterium]
MKLLFERSVPGRSHEYLPESDTELVDFGANILRESELKLPEIAQVDLSRHYTELAEQTHGVNNGFYPLGSCTMKYNPRINEAAASLPGFTKIHPLQDPDTAQGALEVLHTSEKLLCEITGMDAMSFQPAAGAHGEYAGLLLIRAHHLACGDTNRKVIIVPDSAHGTNPASATMAGFTVKSVASNDEGGVDLDALREAVGSDTAGLMLTNPNTLGIFDQNILEITKIVHDAGGLCYYDGANLNAIMGIVRPGDMGFDVVHLNLHKTFSTPHGGGGPGSGPVGCKDFLAKYLPGPQVKQLEDDSYIFETPEHSVGRVRSFYGNFLVVVRALTYVLTLGKEGIPQAAKGAVLNANYMKHLLKEDFDMSHDGICMHEFVMTLEDLKHKTGVSAMDVAKRLLDFGMHPPTMYFPLIVHEALMLEPTETESKETLDEVVGIFKAILKEAYDSPDILHNAPHTCAITRPDDVRAARMPQLCCAL